MLRCAGLIRSWRTATAGRKNGGEESKPLDETLRLTSYSLSNQKHTHKGADDNHETKLVDKNIWAKKYFNLTNKTILFICEGTVNTFTLILKFIITIWTKATTEIPQFHTCFQVKLCFDFLMYGDKVKHHSCWSRLTTYVAKARVRTNRWLSQAVLGVESKNMGGRRQIGKH